MLDWGAIFLGGSTRVEGISRTILELTRSYLVDSGRESELAEILASRDPVRLVTSRGLFGEVPLALLSLELTGLAERLYRGTRWLDARGLSMVLETFASGAGEGTLAGVLAAVAPGAAGAVTMLPGSGLVLAGAKVARELASALTRAFHAATGEPLSIAIEELWPDEALLGRSPDLVRPPRFGVLAEAIRARAAAAALAAPPAGFACLPGFLERCGACRAAPAAHEAEVPGEGAPERLCAACHARRELARTQVETPSPHLEQAFELAETERERHEEQAGQVALMAANVEGLPALVAGLGGVDQVALTHRAIGAAIDTAVSELVEKLGLRRRWQRHAAGAGEVWLLVPASRALDGVRRLVEGAEAGLAREAEALGGYPEIQEGLRRMRLSVGVAFAPSTYGPALVAQLARALIASARRLSLRRDPLAPPASTVDFWVLSDGSPHSTCMDELRHHVYETRRDARLTRRPYLYTEFKHDVIEPLRAFRRLPRADVAELKHTLTQDPRAADLNLRYHVARSEEWRAFAVEVAGKDPARWEALLFRTGADGARETSFVDLAELSEFHD